MLPAWAVALSLLNHPVPDWPAKPAEKWVQGAPAALSDLRGKVVLVRFFTEESCPYCSETAPALNIDLAPTISDAAGVPTPATDGESLLPLLDDPNSAWRRDFLIEHLEGTNPVTTYCAVRSARWKYVRYATGEEELYDLDADPFELENLAAHSSHL